MLENLWLLTRNLVMTVLFPGTVVVYIPYRLLDPYGAPELTSLSLPQYSAMLLLATGVAILFKCIWSFAYVGKGTLAPFDETQKLIVVGLYRYVRNPMYVGVMLILLCGVLVLLVACFAVLHWFLFCRREHACHWVRRK